MRLAPESHRRIETFLRDHLGREGLKLPPVYIHSGRGARLLTSTFDILAITFGRHVFVAPKVIGRDDEGRATVSAKLIAHEATHVVQYHESGRVGFLYSYLLEYWRALLSQPGWDKAARRIAYMKIRQEREAYEAENAYRVWNGCEPKAG